jgi:hypothetical protein
MLRAAVLAVGFLLNVPATALTISATNTPQAGDDNVIFNACGGAAQADALTVQGVSTLRTPPSWISLVPKLCM